MNWLTRLRVRRFVLAFKRWLEDVMRSLRLLFFIVLALLLSFVVMNRLAKAESPKARAKAAFALAAAPKACPCDCPCATGSVCDCVDCKCENCPGVKPVAKRMCPCGCPCEETGLCDCLDCQCDDCPATYRWERHSSGHWILLYVDGEYVGAWCSQRQAYYVDGYKAQLPCSLPAAWKPKARKPVVVVSGGGC